MQSIWVKNPKNTQLCRHNKIPSLESFCRHPLAFGTWDSMGPLSNGFFFHPTLKYPAAPKIPSSVDTTKYPAWSLFVDIPWLLGHRTAWDHYKRKTISIPPKEIPSCPKMPSSVDTSLFVDIPWLLGHGTAWDQWKTTRK